MKLTFRKELPLLAIISIPILYLASIWNELPSQVPIHWDINGEVDGYGDKSELVFLSLLLPLFTYALMLAVPFLDPKDKIKNMGDKFHKIKFALVLFMSVLSIYITYASKNAGSDTKSYIVPIMGVMFIVLGNYFKTIKANYFVGIRTPWTLENEEVWNKTHKMGGMLWFIGGLLILLAGLLLPTKLSFIIFFIITTIITIVPIVYSYTTFKSLSK